MEVSLYNESNNQLEIYSLSLSLRKPIYYIRLKSSQHIYSLSLKTRNRRIALSKLQIAKQELTLQHLDFPFTSHKSLQQYFKNTIHFESKLAKNITLSTIQNREALVTNAVILPFLTEVWRRILLLY